MRDRTIKRIALLSQFRNRPELIRAQIPEAAAGGYTAVGIWVNIGQESVLADLAAEAQRCRLEVMVVSGFMKYEAAWLRDHPDHRLVLNTDLGAKDQDQLGIKWGCPFNPEFQGRYFDFLATIGRVPNLTCVWVNDEAFLGFDAHQLACYCPVCQADWRKEFHSDPPRPPFATRAEKVRFIRWRFDRWNAVHGRMRAVLNRDHPVETVFLTSPVCCLDLNPWVTGVDFAGFLDHIDGLMTDPYYTFHLNRGAGPYLPREVYLSECCRYLHGTCGSDEAKSAWICAQGFSHPTFIRPLDERDGWWAGVVPLALGIDRVTAFTYNLQKISPMYPTYEQSFRLDEHFAKTRPVEFVAVVDSLETRCFDVDVDRGEASWSWSRLMPVTEGLRHHGLPYTYLPSRRLEGAGSDLSRWPVIALPGVSCLSSSARARLRQYVHAGGLLVAFGETATRDEDGEPVQDRFLAEVFGIRSLTPQAGFGEFVPAGASPAFADLPWPDEVTAEYWGGVFQPVLKLHETTRVAVEPVGEVLARFTGADPQPAVVTHRLGQGRSLYLAGIPSRWVYNPTAGYYTLNFANRVISRLILEWAGDRLPVRAVNYPPQVPIQRERPLDPRWIPTFEFLPTVGEDRYLVAIPSYFKEPAEFQIHARVPPGKKCREIRELIADVPVTSFQTRAETVEVDVRFTFDDCLKVFLFAFG